MSNEKPSQKNAHRSCYISFIFTNRWNTIHKIDVVDILANNINHQPKFCEFKSSGFSCANAVFFFYPSVLHIELWNSLLKPGRFAALTCYVRDANRHLTADAIALSRLAPPTSYRYTQQRHLFVPNSHGTTPREASHYSTCLPVYRRTMPPV